VKSRNLFTKVKTAKKRKPSSTRWLERHFNDPYVKQSKADGYRSRAAYKLVEIDDKFKLLKKSALVVDLGAAPGSWSQVALERGARKVIALDLLEIEPMAKIDFILGDFTSEEVMNQLEKLIGTKKISLILSDMAPNTSGHKKADHLKIIVLCEQVFEFAKTHLEEGGAMVVKLFQGGAEEELLSELKRYFTTIKHFKPDSSRKDSSEVYLVANGFKILKT
jgi:23S rRNA (uridine2552-2'-O)-methyltransferase